MDEWIATLVDESPESGDVVIGGRILTENGKPLAGVEVRAHPEEWGEPYPESADDLKEALRRSGSRLHKFYAGAKTALTGADGRYEITRLGDHSHKVRPRLEGYVFTRVRKRYSNDESVWGSVDLDFTAMRASPTQFLVHLPNGTKPEDVFVTAQREGDTDVQQYYGAEFTRALPHGTWKFTARAGENGEHVCSVSGVEIPAVDDRVVLQLRPNPGIHLRLKLKHTAGDYNGFKLYMLPNPSDREPTFDMFQYDHPGYWQNEVTYTDLLPGTYQFVVTLSETVVGWKNIVVGDEFVHAEFEVPPPDPNDFLVVRVFTPGMESVKHVSVTAELYAASSEFDPVWGMYYPPMLEDGSYWFARPVIKSDERLTYQFKVEAGDLGIHSVTLPYEETQDVVIQMPEPAIMELVFTGFDQHQWKEQIRVRLNHIWDNGYTRSGGQFPEVDGKWLHEIAKSERLEVGPVKPGTYEVKMSCNAGYRWEEVQGGDIMNWQFKIIPGRNVVECPIPALYQLTLLIDDPANIEFLRMKHTQPWVTRFVGDEFVTNEVSIRALPPGKWTIETDIGNAVVELEADAAIELKLNLYDCLKLAWFKPDGEIAVFGLKPGDKLIAVDGQAYDNTRVLNHQLDASLDAATTIWTVLRGREEMQVKLDGRALKAVIRKLEAADGDEDFAALAAHR